MKKNHYNRVIQTAGLFLFAVNASAQQNPGDMIYQDSTNRVSLSLRFGLNISARFSGIGNPNVRTTPDGLPYNYDNGYVYPDLLGPSEAQTWNWGYDQQNQVHPNAANNGGTIDFNRTSGVASGNSSANADNNAAIPGFELAYQRQLGVKENWHHMRYGIEGAFNYQPISIVNNSTFGATATVQTDVYGYAAPIPPPGYLYPQQLPYQGSRNIPDYLINLNPNSSTPSTPIATVSVHDNFDANLWGFRLGPYLEFPFGKHEQFTLSLSGGFAVGLLDANESWKQTITIPADQTSINSSGGGSDFDVLWGGYAELNAGYQISERWSIVGGVQFQDLGKYNQTFDGRQVSLDLSKSVFFLIGISYNF